MIYFSYLIKILLFHLQKLFKIPDYLVVFVQILGYFFNFLSSRYFSSPVKTVDINKEKHIATCTTDKLKIINSTFSTKNNFKSIKFSN